MIVQMSAGEAREACRHWWMKEALDILVARVTSPMKQNEQEEEEENVISCLLS